MSFKPFLRLLRSGQLFALVGATAELKSFYKLTYLAAAGEAGLLTRLSAGPATLDSLADFYAANGHSRETLEAWLQFGVRLRLLSLGARIRAARTGQETCPPGERPCACHGGRSCRTASQADHDD
jgi:4-hydroxy-2,2'-bipyrrole-5-carbaldehyde O-methyltransferase